MKNTRDEDDLWREEKDDGRRPTVVMKIRRTSCVDISIAEKEARDEHVETIERSRMDEALRLDLDFFWPRVRLVL